MHNGGSWLRRIQRVFMAAGTADEVEDEKDGASEEHQQDDPGCALQEEGIRQEENDGIGLVVKEPVVVAKEKLVEGHKGFVKVECDSEAGGEWEQDCCEGGSTQIGRRCSGVLLAAQQQKQQDQTDRPDKEKCHENLLHLSKVDKPFLGGGEIREFKGTKEEGGIVIDQGIIIIPDLHIGKPGSAGNAEMADVPVVEWPEIEQDSGTEGSKKQGKQDADQKIHKAGADFIFH